LEQLTNGVKGAPNRGMILDAALLIMGLAPRCPLCGSPLIEDPESGSFYCDQCGWLLETCELDEDPALDDIVH